jgi:hypothetical protein
MALYILSSAVIVMTGPTESAGGDLYDREIELSLYPDYIYAGLPAKIRAVADVSSDPSLDRSSVMLHALDENGKQTFIAYLYDDATHGDAVANDNIFVNVLIPGETKPRIITYQVSASFGGAQKSSLPTYLVVKPNPNLEGLWAEFVSRMVTRDLDGALMYFRKECRAKYRASYKKVGIDEISASYKTARDLTCFRIFEGNAEFRFTITINGNDFTGTTIFYLEPDGAWRIHGLYFQNKG